MFDRTFSGVLGPHFAQLKHIGGGGSGFVYSGFDRRFDFAVCIKRVSVTNTDDCRAALREIRIRRRLQHGNILGLLNAITCDGTDVSKISPTNFRDNTCIFFIQELLDADLRQVIESNNRLSDDYVKLFFYQLLRGLKYIHSANVLHRDLKPSNILVNVNSLELVIGDFGHAIVLDPDYVHTSDQVSCNTSLWYKAPEVILGSSSYSTASDMWAVGCILAEMLLGRPLFEGENELEQLELIIHTIEVNERDQGTIRQSLTEEVNKMYTGKPKFPLRSKFQKVDFHALHLLEHLLSFNASDRVTTELALSHPFLHEYSCVADEPVCLKPLHLEHEVDDFLEYTLKDLIVGECAALAHEQPRIQMQMSSMSSIMDIVKELNDSPTGSNTHSVEDGKPVIKVTCDSDTEGATSRFKVLEVLKEEHTSSSDSNGVTSHEEGVKEEPLVSDHAASVMVSSHHLENEHHKIGHHRRHSHHRQKTSLDETSCNGATSHEESVNEEPLVSDLAATICAERWKHERHKVVHRRHHTHHRRKTSADESSRCRKVKVHKTPSLEREALSDSNLLGHQVVEHLSPEGYTPGTQSPTHGSYSDLSLQSNGVSELSSEHSEGEPSHDDDKVKDLIHKSQQLIADHLPEDQPSESGSHHVITENGHHGNALEEHNGVTEESETPRSNGPVSGLDNVADVIRRSRELLGDIVDDHVPEPTTDTSDVVPEYTLQSMVSDPYHLRESNRRMQELLEESHTLLNSLPTNPSSGSTYLASTYGSMQRVGSAGNEDPLGAYSPWAHPIHHEPTTAGDVSTNDHTGEKPFDETMVESDALGGVLSHEEPADGHLNGDDIEFYEMKAVLGKAKELLKQTEGPPWSDREEELERKNGSIFTTACSKNIESLDNSPMETTRDLNSYDPNSCASVTILDEQRASIIGAATEDTLDNPPMATTHDVSSDHVTILADQTTSIAAAGDSLHNLITLVENHDRVTCNQVCPPEPIFHQQAIVFEIAVINHTPDFQQSVLRNSNPTKHARKSLSGNHDDKSPLVHVGKPTSPDHDDSQSHARNVGPVVCSMQNSISHVDDFNTEKSLVDGNTENSIPGQPIFSSNFTPKNDEPLSNITAQNDEPSSNFTPKNVPSSKSTAHVHISNVIKNVSHNDTRIVGSMNDYWEHDPKRATNDRVTRDDKDEECVLGYDGKQLVQRRAFGEEASLSEDLNVKRPENTEQCVDNKLTSKDIVGNFCRTNCRTANKSAKDEAGLKNFYATIRINTLMNRSRTYRDRLHEAYPF